MRVIAGSLKGRRLQTPTWDGLRPTSDKLRETLFNVLAAQIGGARVLDAYAGTGAVGIEAWSRGAAHVTFVERDRRAAALIAANLAHCGIINGCVIIRDTVAHALDALRGGPPFDIVLLDPPYDLPASGVLAACGDVVAPAGLVVLEYARRLPPPPAAGQLTGVRQIASGDSGLALYRRTLNLDPEP
jgi:16S rRNA (guanine966-N2)-methyltransferase